MPRAASNTAKNGKTRHDPLHLQLQDDEFLEKYGRVTTSSKRKSRKSKPDDDSNDPDVRAHALPDAVYFLQAFVSRPF